MNDLAYKSLGFEIKAAEPEGERAKGKDAPICCFEGMGAVYHGLDGWGDVIEEGAFKADLPFMLDQGKIRDEHCITTGRIVGALEGDKGLFIKGEVYDTSNGRDQAVLLRTKTITRLSIGYKIMPGGRVFLEDEEGVKAYWQEKGYTPSEEDLLNLCRFGGARVLKRVRVYEVSTTWSPANTEAGITGVKSDPQGGRTFAENSRQVLAAVEELIGRAEDVAAMRKKSARHMAPESVGSLKALSAKLGLLLKSLETEQGPQPHEAKGADGAAEIARFLALRAGFLGVNV